MATLIFSTGGNGKERYYKISKEISGGKVTRISCKEYDDVRTNPMLGRIQPKIGDKVTIIIKPYHKYICKTGIVKNVLTRRKIHTRGHKVRLESGDIGRTLKIINDE